MALLLGEVQSGLPTISEDFSEGEMMRAAPVKRMLPLLERRDAVIDEACRTAPHHDVTTFEVHAAHRIGTVFAAPQEYGR